MSILVVILNELISDQYGITKDTVKGYLPPNTSQEDIDKVLRQVEAGSKTLCRARIENAMRLST